MQRSFTRMIICVFALLCLNACKININEVLIVAYTQLDFKAVDSPMPFDVSTNFLWNVEVEDSWITVSPLKAYGDKQLTVTVANNTSIEPRTGTFYIVGEKKRQAITVNQEGEEPVLSIAETSRTISSDGGELEIELSTNLDLTVSCSDSWISFVSTRTVSSKKYVFNVSPNTDLMARAATVVFNQVNGTKSVKVTVGQTGEAESLEIQETEVNIPAQRTEKTVIVNSNIEWEATTAEEWITIVTTKKKEDKELDFVVAENPRVEPREGSITVRKKGSSVLTKTIVVKQVGAEPSLVLTPESFTDIPYQSKETYTVKVNANFEWAVNTADTDNWIASVNVNRADSTVRFTVKENEDVVSRTTSFVISQQGGTFYKGVNIVQLPSPERLAISAGTVDMKKLPAVGGEFVMQISSNVEWSANVNKEWLRLVQTKGVDTKSLTLVVDSHTDITSRSAQLVIKTAELTETIDIVQLAAEASITVKPSVLILSGAEQTKEIAVTTNVEWDYEGLPEWVQEVRSVETKGMETQTRSLKISANITKEERSAEVKLKQKEGSVQAKLNITQVAPVIKLTPENAQLPAAGAAAKQIAVFSEVPWTMENKPEWMTVTGVTAGSSAYDSIITYKVSANLTAAARTQFISFRHTEGQASVDFNLSQMAGSIKPTPENHTIAAAGGEVSILVSSTLPWEMVSIPEWMSVKSTTGITNSLDSTITFNILANLSAVDRTGSVVFKHIDGQVESRFTVFQTKPSIVLSRSKVDTTASAALVPIKVTADVDWNIVSLPDWITLQSKTEEGEVVLAVSANNTSSARSAVIHFMHTGGSYYTALTINQKMAGISVMPSNLDFQNSSGQQNVTLDSQVAWTVSSCPGWIQVTPSSGQNGAQSVKVLVDANTDTGRRIGKVAFLSANNTSTDTLTVVQAGGAAYITPSLSNSMLDNEGETFRLVVKTNVEPQLVIPVSWITLVSKEKSDTTKEITFVLRAAATTTETIRQADLSLVNGDLKVPVIVRQKSPHISKTDSLCLINIYKELGGSGWRDDYVWNLDQSAASWPGVGLGTAIRGGAYRVDSLRLRDARLSGVLPESIKNMEYLEVLDLSNNVRMLGNIYASWTALTYLTYLDLSDCSLTNGVALIGGGTTNIPAAFGPESLISVSPLPDLKVFRVYGNMLSGEIPERVTRHPHYTEWNFAVNIAPQKLSSLTLPGVSE